MSQMRKSFGNVLLLFVSLSASLLLGEYVVRTSAPQDLSGTWRVASKSGLLLNKSSGNAVHSATNSRVEYRFHSPGLRDTQLKENAETVLVLGDSFTFGWLLAAEDTYVRQLQVQADREFGESTFNLVNAAAGGWGTAHYVAYTEEFGDTVAPKMVVVFLNTDDIGRSIASNLFSLSGGRQPTLRRNNMRRSLVKAMANRLPGYQLALENSHLVQLVRKVAVFGPGAVLTTAQSTNVGSSKTLERGPKSPPTLDPSPAILLGKALFLRLSAWCKQRSIRLVVLTTGWHQLGDGEEATEPTVAFMREAGEFFDARGIEFHDLSPSIQPYLRTNWEDYIIAGAGHPNARGSALIAKFTWPALRESFHAYCELTSKCSRRTKLRG